METGKINMDEIIKTVQDTVTDEVQKKAQDKLSELQATVEKNLEESTANILPVDISTENPNLKTDLSGIQEQFSNFIQVAESTTDQIKQLGLETAELEQIKVKIDEHRSEVKKAAEFLTQREELKNQLKQVEAEASTHKGESELLAN